MTTRREFLTQAGVITAAAVAVPNVLATSASTSPTTDTPEPDYNGATDLGHRLYHDKTEYSKVTEMVIKVTDTVEVADRHTGNDPLALLYKLFRTCTPDADNPNRKVFDHLLFGKSLTWTDTFSSPWLASVSSSVFPYPVSYQRCTGGIPEFADFSLMRESSFDNSAQLSFESWLAKIRYAHLHILLFSTNDVNVAEVIRQSEQCSEVSRRYIGESYNLSKPMKIKEIDQKLRQALGEYNETPKNGEEYHRLLIDKFVISRFEYSAVF